MKKGQEIWKFMKVSDHTSFMNSDGHTVFT